MDSINRLRDAIELQDLELLRKALDDDLSVDHVFPDGTTPLHRAVDVEIDSHIQTGEPLHVDVTAYLIARGADPNATANSLGQTPLELAASQGHWLAVAVFEGCRPMSR